MSDRPPDPATPDEIVSAYVDGEATAAERALVDADPAWRARAAEFATLAANLGAAPPTGLVDDHIAGALAAFDGASPDVETSDVATLREARDRRSGWHRRIPVGAVAAVVAVVALVGALTQIDLDQSGEDTAATVERDVGESADREDQSAALSNEMANEAASPSSVLVADSVEALVGMLDAIRTGAFAGGADDAATAPPPGDSSPMADAAADADGAATGGTPRDHGSPCDPIAAAALEPDRVVEVLAALVDGQPVTVVRALPTGGDDQPDAARLVIIDDGTCTVVFDRTG